MPICAFLVERALRKVIRRARDLCRMSPCSIERSLEILAVFGLWLVAIEPTSRSWGQQEIQKETSSTQGVSPQQHFVCNIGYTKKECQVATAVLRNVLERYPVDALGEWTWVLVRTADWKFVLPAKGINMNNPAFSNLTKRVTFIDGALVNGVSIRGMELRMVWHMPVEELLDLTIRHELAHALCNERDEFKTDRATIDLKNGTLSCRVSPQASGASR